MNDTVARVWMHTKHLREERWDVLGKLFMNLENQYKNATGKDLDDSAIAPLLQNAGAVYDETMPKSRTPQMRLCGMADRGKFFYVFADENCNLRYEYKDTEE